MSNDSTSHAARKEKMFLLELYFDGYLCVKQMLEGLRGFALEEPDFVYKEFTANIGRR